MPLIRLSESQSSVKWGTRCMFLTLVMLFELAEMDLSDGSKYVKSRDLTS